MVLKLRDLPNSHRAQLSKLHLVMSQLVVKEADTTLPIQLLRLNSKELAKALNLNSPAIHNNLKLAITLMAIRTTRAHTMLRTWISTSSMAVETMELTPMAQRLAFTNLTRAMECLLPALLMSMPHLQPLEVLEALLFKVVIVRWVEV
jgi:hypothetical protein